MAKPFHEFFLLVFVSLFLMPVASHALQPEQILVLANRNAARSLGLANYYMKRRNIPEKNLLSLWMTDKEWCT
ncbi:hypothetical protein ACFL9T_06950, partial [Thermodesulfobacteriota bacterium]